MKKTAMLLAALGMAVLCLLPLPVRAANTCGDGVTWSLSSGTLTISYTGSGAGAITSNPWTASSVKQVKINSGVTGIGAQIFKDHTNLTSITIPSTVVSIGAFAFSGCSKLKSVSGLGSITSVEEYTFACCSSLTGITIPEGVEGIGPSAFTECTNLASVSFPSTLKFIGTYAFGGENAISEIHIASVESWLALGFGGNGSYPNRPGCRLYLGSSELTKVTIPSGVTSIRDYAFNNFPCLTQVTIPSSVTEIGAYAFSNCSGLTAISMPGAESIGEYAFKDCSGLTSVTIPESLESIGKDAFTGCTSLATVCVASIDSWLSINYSTKMSHPNAYRDVHLYVGSTEQKEIRVPSGTERIGDYAFYNCGSLTGVTIPSGVTGIGTNAFSNCGSLTEITLPSGMESIGNHAFYNCESLEAVTIPESVDDIGSYAFYSCPQLANIYYEGTEEQWAMVISGNTIPSETLVSCSVHCHHLERKETEATCTAPGTEPYWECSVCGDLFSDAAGTETLAAPVTIPELGHDWGEPDYTWSDDHLSVTAVRTCSRDAGHKETETVPATGVVTTEPTCEGKGKTTYTSGPFTNGAFVVRETTEEDVEALGHDWKEPEYSWDAGHTQVTAVRTCRRDAEHRETETVKEITAVPYEATCTEPGGTEYTSAAFENEAFRAQTDRVAEGEANGDHDWGEPVYTWSADRTEVTAARTCKRAEAHTETETAGTAVSVTKSPTDTAAGSAKYTVVFENAAFKKQTKTVRIPALADTKVLRLPAKLKTVGAEAFAGTDCEAVLVSEGCTAIGAKAFAGCAKLLYVRIPKSVTSIAPDAFEGCGAVILDRQE